MTTTDIEKARKTLATAVRRLDNAKSESAIAKATTARDNAMLAMRDAGASYAQIAEALGVVPMTARSRVLKAQASQS